MATAKYRLALCHIANVGSEGGAAVAGPPYHKIGEVRILLADDYARKGKRVTSGAHKRGSARRILFQWTLSLKS